MHYESERLLAEYLLFHYGTADEVLPAGRAWPDGMAAALDFPARLAACFSPGEAARGLDLGCAVGRATFEMARHCREVIGLDNSQSFIRAANRLLATGALAYDRLDEGHLATRLTARPPHDVDGSRVSFRHGDAMNLPPDLGTFDRVLAANLLCRLPQPTRFLQQLPALLVPGGEIVLATPGTWLDEFTPRDQWPQGSTFDFLWENLRDACELLDRSEQPFLLRETSRKFQWSYALVTRWRRRC